MENVKEKLTAAIEAALHDGITNQLTARKLSERVVVVLSDFVQVVTPGPTGEFPEGKLEPNDEGQLKMLISHDDKIVRVEFGRPTAWIAMPTSQALQFAFAVLEHCGVKIEHQIQQDPASGEPA